jgi:hypothetical protein
LKNKTNYIFKQPYSKNDYLKKAEEFNLKSRINVETLRVDSVKYWMQFPKKFIHGRHNSEFSGEYIATSSAKTGLFYLYNTLNSIKIESTAKGLFVKGLDSSDIFFENMY